MKDLFCVCVTIQNFKTLEKLISVRLHIAIVWLLLLSENFDAGCYQQLHTMKTDFSSEM